MKPNKLKRKLEKKHLEIKNKAEEYFHRKLDENRIQQESFVNSIIVSSKTLLTSYQVSYRIAKNTKTHTITETAIDMVQTMFGQKCVQQLGNIPLSHNKVSRRIADISEDRRTAD
jgi:hypothetical protein